MGEGILRPGGGVRKGVRIFCGGFLLLLAGLFVGWDLAVEGANFVFRGAGVGQGRAEGFGGGIWAVLGPVRDWL